MATLAASPIESDGNGRKRVCKACDRCRLKKSKVLTFHRSVLLMADNILSLWCDGSSPCGRCQSDNAICVFGERKKAQDKIYPKGFVSNLPMERFQCRANAVINDDSYVEMLEQQQNQLVAGLQALYALVTSSASWKGAPLKESVNGHPLTHDILQRLGVLHLDLNAETDAFEEDLDVLRQKFASETDSVISLNRRSQSSGYRGQNSFPEVASPRHYFSDSFPTLHQFPPTPPIQSPNGETSFSPSPIDCQNRLDNEASLDPSVLQPHQPSIDHLQSTMYDDSLDFLSFSVLSNFDASNPMQESTSPCLSISPWLHDDLSPFGLKTSDT